MQVFFISKALSTRIVIKGVISLSNIRDNEKTKQNKTKQKRPHTLGIPRLVEFGSQISYMSSLNRPMQHMIRSTKPVS